MSELLQLGLGQVGNGLLAAFWRGLSIPTSKCISSIDNSPFCASNVSDLRLQLEACESPEGILIFVDSCYDSKRVHKTIDDIAALIDQRIHLDVTCIVPGESSVDRLLVDYHRCVTNLALLSAECNSIQLIDACALLDIANFMLRTQNGTYERLYDIGMTPTVTFIDALSNMENSTAPCPSYIKTIKCLTHAFPFYAGGYSPFVDARKHVAVSVRDLCWGLFRPENHVACVNPYDGRYVSACAAFRGGPDLTIKLIESHLNSHNRHIALGDHWRATLPRRIHCYLDNQQSNGHLETAFFGCNTALADNLSVILDRAKTGSDDIQHAREYIQHHAVDLCNDISKYLWTKTGGRDDHAFLWHNINI